MAAHDAKRAGEPSSMSFPGIGLRSGWRENFPAKGTCPAVIILVTQ
jgi:hypothetical protein